MKKKTTFLCLALFFTPLASFAGWAREAKDPYLGIKMFVFLFTLSITSALFVGLISAFLTRIILFVLNSLHIIRSNFIFNFKNNKKTRHLSMIAITLISVFCFCVTNKFHISAIIAGIVWGCITSISFRFFLLKFTPVN
jgi:hypothetical protein